MKKQTVLLIFLSVAALYVAHGKPPNDEAPALKLWYDHPAAKWESALPVGNGRLGAMVFGKTDIERIQLNEETYWSGGPYSQTVNGGYKYLP